MTEPLANADWEIAQQAEVTEVVLEGLRETPGQAWDAHDLLTYALVIPQANPATVGQALGDLDEQGKATRDANGLWTAK